MDTKFTFFSPAKINLFFRVLNKRDDGYHNIASLIQMLNLGDTLSISLSGERDSFSTNVSFLFFDERNLIYKALELFKKKTNLNFFLKIYLEKSIPIQSGLGGGSGNAATMLYALNTLLKTNISDQVLAQWGSELGADVPCFFSSGRVFCQGIGEKLTPILYKEEEYWIAKPFEYSLSTPLVYQNFSLEDRSEISPSQLLNDFEKKNNSCFVNDLESAAFRLIPDLKKFKKSLLDLGFKNVMMTGSGTAFFCIGDVKFPQLNETLFFKTKSISRDKNNWYTN